MLIGFLGDLHGQVFHAIAALLTWQQRSGRAIDLIIQTGDMGAFPDWERMPESDRQYLAADPSQGDFKRLLEATGRRAESLRRARAFLSGPIHFIRGNHEDVSWLRSLPRDPSTGFSLVDPFDLLRYVPDGTMVNPGPARIAFLGGEETEEGGEAAIDQRAYAALMGHAKGEIDVLVTHDGPWGVATGYRGNVQGSRQISRLAEHLQPTFHLSGHYGQIGPLACGPTTYLCLGHIVASPIRHPEVRGLLPGCMAILDTDAGKLQPVSEPWLTAFDRDVNFDELVGALPPVGRVWPS